MTNDGGPAFPRPLSLTKPKEVKEAQLGDWFSGAQDGMSLRDYFAAQAMSGLLSPGHGSDPKHISILSYRIADAMLKEREHEQRD